MRRVVGIIGLLLLVLSVSARAIPVATPVGRQCPTAQVHTIRVAVKSACGCVIGHIERAPKPGEKGFVQCQCGEKRVAQESSAPPAPALSEAPLLITYRPTPRFFVELGAPFVGDFEVVRVPLLPPPATV